MNNNSLIEFAEFLGLYLLKVNISEAAQTLFYNSNYEMENKDQYMIYKILKNAPDLNDPILRQMIIKML